MEKRLKFQGRVKKRGNRLVLQIGKDVKKIPLTSDRRLLKKSR